MKIRIPIVVLMLLIMLLPVANGLPSIFTTIQYPLTFFFALALALWATPLARDTALRYHIVDQPDGKLKDHRAPVPYLGGIVLYIAFLLTLSFVFGFNAKILGITQAGSVLVIIGLFDDMQAVTPRVKFLGQLIAVYILMKAGIRIELIALPEWLNVPLTALWMTGIINAVNIIDIMDGLAVGVGFCAAIVLFLVSVINENTLVAILALALAGSLLGLLRYNFEPAKIYLGDTGSMFLGLMLGSLAMIGRYSEQNNLGFVAPILILGVPIFDMLFVMFLRSRKGISMFLGSKDHFALRCRKMGFSVKQTVLLSYAMTLILGGVAVLIMQLTPVATVGVLFVVVAVVCFLAAELSRVEMPSNKEVFHHPPCEERD